VGCGVGDDGLSLGIGASIPWPYPRAYQFPYLECPVFSQTIHIEAASTHNLRHISLDIPKHQLVVFTGVSGSGKSSLVFDTVFAESQRRYVESLNTYARQFIGQMERPVVKRIEGLSPAIAIDQKSASNSPRSTVGTVTEVLDYLRVLYARIGEPHCPTCGQAIAAQSPQQMIDSVSALPQGTKVQVLAPVVRGRKGDYNALFAQLRKEGLSRARIDGEDVLLDELPEDYRLARTKTHTIEVVIDRLILKPGEALAHRLSDAIYKALKKGDGFVTLQTLAPKAETGWQERTLSRYLACTACDTSFGEMAPRVFSFNSPYGACQTCQGAGFTYEVNVEQLVPDPTLTLKEGALAPLKRLLGRGYGKLMTLLAKEYGLRTGVPYRTLTAAEVSLLLNGPPRKGADAVRPTLANATQDDDETDTWLDLLEHFEGVQPALKQRFQTASGTRKRYLKAFFVEAVCSACRGARLQPFPLAVTLGGLSIEQVCQFSITDALAYVVDLPAKLSDTQLKIARSALQEVEKRLRFLLAVGLDYLTLSRRANTLSGGEAQRIRLASQIGSGLVGVLYVLDEPTIGLHPHNNQQLINTLKSLRDKGNSVLVVEHDEDMIRQADWLIDVGPHAGRHGGEIVVSGPPDTVGQVPTSLTGAYLDCRTVIAPNPSPRTGTGHAITLANVCQNNLKSVTAAFPLGTFTCVTGMSGSGKSTLVFDVLLQAVRHHFDPTEAQPLETGAVTGLEHIKRFVVVDQSPIGRTSRSTPATYANLMDPIRNLFSNTALAKIRGWGPGHFSFNVKGGRCEVCKGEGQRTIEMKFLPNASVQCEACHGRRYSADTLEVRYHDLNIYEVLNLSVGEALAFFADVPSLTRMLQVLDDIGLDYIQLGQPAPTLSGGEAQRLKLATELMTPSKQPTLYLMDEPTIGLHWHDLAHLLTMLHRLVDGGHSVVAIEHNLDFIQSADWLLDLGPMGGKQGGQLVASGPPRTIADSPASLTGQHLAAYFERHRAMAAV
jgi:excinuclease ABC subunit A